MIKIFDNNMKELEFDIIEYQASILPLDNFSAFGFELNGEYFQTSEHAFQYLKFNETNPAIAKRIKDAFSPNEARNIAQVNRNLKPKNWLDIKYKNMEKVLRAKMEQNPVVRKKLLATRDYIIAEYCTDKDTEWGLDNNNNGQNNLGKIWMKIRSEII
jgi:N-glycosidase YbiA